MFPPSLFPSLTAWPPCQPQLFAPIAVTTILAAALAATAPAVDKVAPWPAASAAEGEPASPGRWIVRAASSPLPARGELLAARSPGPLRLKTPHGELRLNDWYELQRDGRPLPPLPNGPHLISVFGDRITGEVRGVGDGRVRFRPTFLPLETVWSLSFSHIQAVWQTPQPADTPLDPADYDWIPSRKNADVLRTRTGDVLAGVLDDSRPPAAPPTWPLLIGTQLRPVPVEETAAVVCNPLLSRRRPPQGTHLRLVLQDGSRLHLRQATVDGPTLRGTALFGVAVQIPLEVLVAVTVMSQNLIELSDRPVVKAEQRGYLSGGERWRTDRTGSGEPLTLITPYGKSTYDKGIALRPHTMLTWQLPERPVRRLQTWAGLHPTSPPRARVLLRIRTDRTEVSLPNNGVITSGPAVPIELELGEARTLTIEATFPAPGEPGGELILAPFHLVR